MTPRSRVTVAVAAATVAVLAGAAGLYWFQPWRLFTDRTVDEALPTFVSPAGPSATPATSQPPQNVLLATGMII